MLDSSAARHVQLALIVAMIKAVWMELAASYIRNCFRKVGFMDAVEADYDDTVELSQQDQSHL